MKSSLMMKQFTAAALAALVWMVPMAAIGQTRIVAPKNKYKVQDDVKLGRDAANQIERQFPVINDEDATAYIEQVGQRLVAAIPQELNQPAFDYRFKWVNASDLNAFALPGGPMYVNRGMIESARNEGEMAGVMAHEISHVALRHATAQATKQSSAKNTLGTIGLILGGAILGGQSGAQLGAMGAAAWQTKYSREYESHSDILGARIMADAGYDPRDLANVFRTIGQQSRGGGPEWLSSHPDPGNRYEVINREAQRLNVSSNPIKITRDFERIQARFRSMPRARSMADLQRSGGAGRNDGGYNDPSTSGRYSNNVPAPSTRLRSYTGLRGVRVAVPTNWQDLPGQDGVQFAPEGAYGEQGITRGVMIGYYNGQGGDVRSASQSYMTEVLQGNSYLRQRTSVTQMNMGGRTGYTTSASGRSPVTGRNETINIFTAQGGNGELFYLVTVAPEDEAYAYNQTFRAVINSVQFGY